MDRPDAGGRVPLGQWPEEWLIARRGTARAVMAWKGHSTVCVTFDCYGHLFPHALEDLAASLADLRSNPDAFGRSPATLDPITPSEKENPCAPDRPVNAS